MTYPAPLPPPPPPPEFDRVSAFGLAGRRLCLALATIFTLVAALLVATPSTAKAQTGCGTMSPGNTRNQNLSGVTLALTVTGNDAHEGRAITVNVRVESGTLGSRIRVPTRDFISSPTSGHIIGTSSDFMTLNSGDTSTSFTVTVRDDDVYRQNAMLRVDLPRAWANGGWLYCRSATQYYATLMIVDNDSPAPPPLEFAKCNGNRLNGAPTLDLFKGEPLGGEVCYKVRLASEPTRSHVFYATVKRYQSDTSPIGISGKDVYWWGRGNGSQLVKRWNYAWNWSHRGQFLDNNYGITHQFTANNWDEWVTIGVRCCRAGVELNSSNRSPTIYHYVYDHLDREGRSGPNATIDIHVARNSPAQAPPPPPPPSQPTDPVSNVQVTAVDDSSATVTWDAVAHASSYLIDYEGTASDPYNSIAGTVSGHTGTSWTLQHNAVESMTITVTVTPEYLDGDGLIQQADDLAGTATLDVGPGSGADAQGSDAQAEPSCVSDALLGNVEGYAGETWRESADHVERWSRVLAAFGVSNSYGNNPMTATEAQTLADRGLPRWVPVATALDCLETTPEQQPEAHAAQAETPTPTPAPPPTPEMSINAGNDVTEGGDATFTVTASPAPVSDLDVTVTISQNGDFANIGSRTVTISTTGSATFTVATTDDSTDEPDGSVTATLSTGTGYTVSSSSSTATVAVSDNDDAPPPPPPPATNCVSGTMLNQVRHYYDVNKDRTPGYGKNWKRVLIAFGDTTDTNLTAFTAAEARDRESKWSGWRPVRMTLECIEAAN